MQTVYTFGYTGQSLDQLVEWVLANDALVFDIRFSPYSRNPTWTKSSLSSRLSRRYRHVKSFGNRNYKGGPTDIVNLESGVSLIESCSKHPIVLMCMCRNPQQCHRSDISKYLATIDIETRELILDKSPQKQTRHKQSQLLLF